MLKLFLVAALTASAFASTYCDIADASVTPSLDLGARSPMSETTVIVMLPHRNQAQLNDLLRRIASGQARPISHAAFVQTYAPDPTSVSSVAAYLQSNGFTITKTSESLVFAKASTATVERTFSTSIHNMRNLRRYDTYFASQPPRVPTSLARFSVRVVIDNVPLRWVH